MKLVGICRLFKLEEVSDKCAKGQIYFSRKNGEEFETDFVNARIVGKAKQQLDGLRKTKNWDYRFSIQKRFL